MTTRPISARVPEGDTAAPEEERHRLTLEGLTAIEAGQLVPHAEVVAWAQGLGIDFDAAEIECGRKPSAERSNST